MWWKAALLVVLVVAVASAVVLAVVVLYGRARWESGTRELRKQLEAARTPVQPATFAAGELDGLPAPVRRYFNTVLREGQPMVSAVTIEHVGTFNTGETADVWTPFTSVQRVVAQRPGFLWDARMAMGPGLSVYVHDAYVAGVGILRPALFGLFTLVDLRGEGEVAQGELMRFFAEAAWYPTRLLPSQGVRWAAVDDRSALGTLTDGSITLTLLFRFDAEGLIESVRTEARGRVVAGAVVPTPWVGRFWRYASQGGMMVPMQGEVAWLLPDREKPYWRGEIARLRYEFAGTGSAGGPTPQSRLQGGEPDVKNVDARFRRAMKAGAVVLEEPTDTSYGHRRYGVADPEGHEWYFAQPVRRPRSKRKARPGR